MVQRSASGTNRNGNGNGNTQYLALEGHVSVRITTSEVRHPPTSPLARPLGILSGDGRRDIYSGSHDAGFSLRDFYHQKEAKGGRQSPVSYATHPVIHPLGAKRNASAPRHKEGGKKQQGPRKRITGANAMLKEGSHWAGGGDAQWTDGIRLPSPGTAVLGPAGRAGAAAVVSEAKSFPIPIPVRGIHRDASGGAMRSCPGCV